MDYYAITTQVPTFTSFYSSDASAGRGRELELSHGAATKFLNAGATEVNFGTQNFNPKAKLAGVSTKFDPTPLLSDVLDLATPRPFEQSVQVKDAEISKVAEARIKLLAMKYASDTVSAEMIARLEILNSRIIERSPRVTVEQIGTLENSIGAIESIEKSRLDRAKRLGLAI
jgi:hypothetical protein